jgi:hypothetical protein
MPIAERLRTKKALKRKKAQQNQKVDPGKDDGVEKNDQRLRNTPLALDDQYQHRAEKTPP